MLYDNIYIIQTQSMYRWFICFLTNSFLPPQLCVCNRLTWIVMNAFHVYKRKGPSESPFSSLAGVNRTLHDENRVKIQVPSSPPAPAIEKESTSAWSTATIARSGSSSSNSNSNCSISITRMSSTAESRGVVTILEGPVSGTTWLSSTDPVNDPTSKVSSITWCNWWLMRW